MAIGIGRHGVGGALDGHCHANHRLVVGTIEDSALNESLLDNYTILWGRAFLCVLRVGRNEGQGGETASQQDATASIRG